MGVATPSPTLIPPPLPNFRRKLFCWRQIPMSQGFHQGNIFSFSDEYERPQQNHVAQQSRRDKLRVQGFDVSAAGHHLVPPIQEAEEEAAAIFEQSGATNNMLSEMFNFAAPADLLSGQSANNIPPPAYHRLIQQRRPEFYAGGSRQQGMVMNTGATNNWSSLEEAAAVGAKHHGLSPDPSSSAMRLFFMNSPPAAAAGVAPQPMQHHQRSTSPPHHHHSQTFLGAVGSSFVEQAASFGGGVMESQGPSLSLSNSSLQQLEMRKAEEMRVRSQGPGAFFYNSQQQEHQLHPTSIHHAPPSLHSQAQQSNQSQQLHMSYGPVGSTNLLRNSKYARPAQELLEEFCSVGRGHVRGNTTGRNSSNPNPSRGGGGGGASSSAAAVASSSSSMDITPLSPADRFENQRKKSKLLSMLDEVERRYNHYCEQMQMVVNSFDSVMGFGAATPYTALAQKAMSKHFRCLKDAITAQLKQTCELLGDKDGVSGSGLTKGETPKLRLIDQSLRQQRAFHQLGMMEQEAWRPQRGLPDRSVTILRAWLFEHFLHPYPTDADKHLLARQTGLSRNQVSNWFINARVRLWKPMVEDMYQQEAKEVEEEEEDDSKHNEEETNSQRILAAATTQQSISAAVLHSPESDAPESLSNIPRPQLDHYDQLRLAAPAGHHTAADVIFPPGFDDEMYRRAAAVLGAPPAAAAARTGDLSLTLGLRHAGGNAPPDAGRFGF